MNTVHAQIIQKKQLKNKYTRTKTSDHFCRSQKSSFRAAARSFITAEFPMLLSDKSTYSRRALIIKQLSHRLKYRYYVFFTSVNTIFSHFHLCPIVL